MWPVASASQLPTRLAVELRASWGPSRVRCCGRKDPSGSRDTGRPCLSAWARLRPPQPAGVGDRRGHLVPRWLNLEHGLRVAEASRVRRTRHRCGADGGGRHARCARRRSPRSGSCFTNTRLSCDEEARLSVCPCHAPQWLERAVSSNPSLERPFSSRLAAVLRFGLPVGCPRPEVRGSPGFDRHSSGSHEDRRHRLHRLRRSCGITPEVGELVSVGFHRDTLQDAQIGSTAC